MAVDSLFNMSNEELIEWFRKNLMATKFDSEHYAEYCSRIIECIRNIENDFYAEWSQKKCKWFFTKYRQAKLIKKIELRYSGPMFWIIEDITSELIPKEWTADECFDKFVGFKGECE